MKVNYIAGKLYGGANGRRAFCLKRLSDCFYVLIGNEGVYETGFVGKRLKKEPEVLGALYDLIEKIDVLGYRDGVDFAFASKRFDAIRGTNLTIVEIRRIGKTWRVLCYWDRPRRALVLLDAFEAHRHKKMDVVLRQLAPLVREAARLIEAGAFDDNEGYAR